MGQGDMNFPPPGMPHEYLSTVYAVNNKIDPGKNASPAMVGHYLESGLVARLPL
jgi:phosphatidylethanolamine-binding protein (PEBP) family uncharacterized protein